MGIAYVLMMGVLTAGLARLKGYSFFAWFFAAGWVGLSILAFLPVVKQGEDSSLAARYEKTGNIVGAGISAAVICCLAFLLPLR